MLLAVPAIIKTAASISFELRSGSFCLAISSNCALVSLPTFSLLGSPLPFGQYQEAFLIRTAAGGVLTTNVKDLSS